MTLPLTPRPNCPQESIAANESAFTQIFGVMYITLTGLIDSTVLASGPWALLGKLLSYIVKLAPILWWALPARPAGRLQVPRNPPQARSLTIPASAAELPLDHTNKLFEIVYITLTGVIDTIVPAVGPWSLVGKSMSYLIKLAPILWWALLTQSATRQFPNGSNSVDQGWFLDTIYDLVGRFKGNCGKFDSLVIDSLVLDTLLSTRELSAAYVNLLVFLA
ncbi:hypothetical protein DSO57_1016562 [Entomophthora muscae]|uniref:Uncharacterized protein n=1 Tax=Entomophthora muscae TaxID=34485 RepID=A0ACC2S6U0_9FUNG|nr:hypothetical protein DSO57_1016562 [Entomophthora muscae]